jgi:2,4-dienoyl-CoA reductase-like NADH-dependent reductase (Old Yellow Enzyme family)/thioredoxin reductase
LFTPVTIRGITLRNRIVSTPNQTRFKGMEEAAYMAAKARGGAAAVVLGECPVNEQRVRQSHCYTFLPNHAHDIRYMAEAAGMIRAHGAVPGLQLYHPGMYALPHRGGDSLPPIGPMALVRDDGICVEAMDEARIEEAVEDYANAAAAAVKAGFEWVHVQSGHGWLINQFLSPRTNQRTDRWGGSFENRIRFAREVYRRIRERAGWRFVLEIRVSGDEMLPGGCSIEEIADFVAAVDDCVDVVNISAGVHEAHETIYRQFAHSGFTPHGVNRHLAETVKKKGTKALVSVVGGISSPELAEEILAGGQADLIGMARALIADPDFPDKARAGRAEEILPCLRCNNCLLGVGIHDTIRCAVNAKTGTELHWQTAPRPEARRKVVVVGGGPAGLRAAITAAERGHAVTLLEAKDRLSGQIAIADCGDPLKEDLRRFKEHLVAKLSRLAAVDVRLGTPGTAETVAALAPDAVICAVGGTPVIPDIPGADSPKILQAEDAYFGADRIGHRVVVVGGGLVGAETAYFLAAEKGREVTLVEARDTVGDPVDWRQTLPLLERMSQTETLLVRTGLSCTGIDADGVTVRGRDGEGEEECIGADTVILCAGTAAQPQVVEALQDAAPWFRAVGDCVRPGRILAATQGAYWAAMDIL